MGRAKFALHGLQHHKGGYAQAQYQATHHPEVAQDRKADDAAPVSGAVAGAFYFALAHQMDEICLLHGPSQLVG